MAVKEMASNPLTTSKAQDAPLSVQLHPLVLLTISDYITRHTLRALEGPIIGAVVGQQNGRNFTLEHAFESKLAQQNGDVVVDSEWFEERLEQYREVHKAPAQLDLVAMFALGPIEGPQDVHRTMLEHVQKLTGTDGVMLLLFHGKTVDQLQGGKLPISLWESVQEQVGEEVQMRFRELNFEVETGEAEMIGVDFVAKGGGNATAVGGTKTRATSPSLAREGSSRAAAKKGKGKAKEKESGDGETSASTGTGNTTSLEDDELIASLTAKANAIGMLKQRLAIIHAYLDSIPPSYLTDASSNDRPPPETNHNILRSIKAMLSRLPLLAPPNASSPDSSSYNEATANAFSMLEDSASEKEKQDVHLTSLLASLTRSVYEAQNMGTKFSIVQKEKASKERMPGYGSVGGKGLGGPGARMVASDDFDGAGSAERGSF